MMPKTLSIFGATGSIGQNTLDLVRRDREAFDVVALTGGQNIEQLAKDAIEFQAKTAVTADEGKYSNLCALLDGHDIVVKAGANGIREAAHQRADIAMSAIVGAAGLEPGIIALQNGSTLALANKESMVAAGSLMKKTARDFGGVILPVDSEHSAIYQSIQGSDPSEIERIIITASGGAFRDWSREKMAKASPEDALKHPTWDMGARITIDSASMFNKALEVIEAKELFDLTPDQIEVLIHPQSLVHSLVGFQDRGFLAHIGPHDMRHAIGYALYHPKRAALPLEKLDFTKLSRLDFEAPDYDRFPALKLAYDVLNMGGLCGAVFNAAKEIALDGFIDRRIGFLQMADIVKLVLDKFDARLDGVHMEQTLENVLKVDQMARRLAQEAVNLTAAQK